MIAFAHYLSRPYLLVLLAGALRPSPLRKQIGVPILSLPITAKRSLLDAWLSAIEATAARNLGVRIVVSSPEDEQVMRRMLRERVQTRQRTPSETDVIVDPSEWRGPAGLLHDIARQSKIENDTIVVAAEAAVYPPSTLDPLLLRRANPSLAGAIGADDRNRPAGVYAFSAETIGRIPAIGFHDIKEQLLPSLYQSGERIPCVRIVPEVLRLRDRDTYLKAVRESLASHSALIDQSPDAHVSASATLSGACIIGSGVRIEDGALIHDSVLMPGSRIGGGAVVARGIVGPDAHLHARSVVRSAVVVRTARPIPRLQLNRRALGRTLPRTFSLHTEPEA